MTPLPFNKDRRKKPPMTKTQCHLPWRGYIDTGKERLNNSRAVRAVNKPTQMTCVMLGTGAGALVVTAIPRIPVIITSGAGDSRMWNDHRIMYRRNREAIQRYIDEVDSAHK